MDNSESVGQFSVGACNAWTTSSSDCARWLHRCACVVCRAGGDSRSAFMLLSPLLLFLRNGKILGCEMPLVAIAVVAGH